MRLLKLRQFKCPCHDHSDGEKEVGPWSSILSSLPIALTHVCGEIKWAVNTFILSHLKVHHRASDEQKSVILHVYKDGIWTASKDRGWFVSAYLYFMSQYLTSSTQEDFLSCMLRTARAFAHKLIGQCFVLELSHYDCSHFTALLPGVR